VNVIVVEHVIVDVHVNVNAHVIVDVDDLGLHVNDHVGARDTAAPRRAAPRRE
jgi:hypothetical protein